MKKIISTLLCFFILLGCVLPAWAATGVPKEVMESTKSVVRILSRYAKSAATGSGFVIKNEPGEVLIVTNDHVVEGNPASISIWVSEDRMVDAEIVFTTSEKDLCVLRVTDPIDMKPLKLSKEEPQHGAAIYVVGYPGAGDILSDTQAHTSESVTITDGIISAIRSFTIEKGGKPVKLLQVNAAINSGNSGGPLFDTEGVVVGVNTYKVNADSQGVFGSVAISELWSLLDQYDIEIPDEPDVVDAVHKESFFLMPVLIRVGIVCLVLAVILIAKSRSRKTPQRKRKNPKIQTITLQAHMEKHPQGLGIGSAVSLLLPIAVQLRNLHNDGKLHLQICPPNILVSADGASFKEPSSQETGRFNSGFAAPEIYRGAGFGITSDVYSFAAVLLYAATGKVPANSLQQEALANDFDILEDTAFATILRKAMASNILDRTQSMQELIYSIAVFNDPSQPEKAALPKETVVSVREERNTAAPVKAERTVPASAREEKMQSASTTDVIVNQSADWRGNLQRKRSKKPIFLGALLACGILAVILLWQPAVKQEGSVALQSTEQTEIAELSEEEIQYQQAEKWEADGQLGRAAIAFGKLGDYADARERSIALWRKITPAQTVFAGLNSAAAVRNDGSVMLAGYADSRQRQCQEWKDIICICTTASPQAGHTVGLKDDGTVVAVGANQWGQCDVSSWSDIVAIGTSGLDTVGLSSDGTVLYTGPSTNSETDKIQKLSHWENIIAITTSWNTIIGLKTDGTVVVAAGINDSNVAQKVKDWSDIIALSANGTHIAGLKADGTVVDTDNNSDVLQWSEVISIAAGNGFTMGLKSDGTVVSTGLCNNVPLDVSGWSDIAAISAYSTYAIGVKYDGSVMFIGSAKDDALIKSWTDIALPGQLKLTLPKKAPKESPKSDQAAIYAEAEKLLANGETARAAIAFGKLGDYKDARERSIALWEGDTVSAGPYHVAAIQNNGSVVAVGHDLFGQDQCRVQDWKDIVSVAASGELTAGLRSDGTVVVTYDEDLDFRKAVSHWEDIIQIGAAGRSVVGLKADGSIVWVKQVTWDNGTPTCDLDDGLRQWKDIVSISVCDGNRIAGRNDWENSPAIAGLRKDGTVILHGFDEKIAQKVSEWSNIVSIHTAGYGISGRKADGTMVGAYLNQNIADAVAKWPDIVDIDSSSVEGGIYVIGVRSDGTTAVWGDRGGLDGASNWNDIVSVDIGDTTGMCFKRPIIGLKADGTVVVTGWGGNQPDLSAFTDIRLP